MGKVIQGDQIAQTDHDRHKMGTFFQNLEEFYKCKFYKWDLRISLSPFLRNGSPGKGGK